uniref:ubiquitinyl hydrolase 1 n=1 Tax=Oryzias latipes TaxID=8090 RepID=A0A3B3IKA9_ORYLA
MESCGNMSSSEERSVEKSMDVYLKSIGLHRKKIAKDGSCLFRAVAEQVLHCQSLHREVRAKCVDFLKQNRDSYEAFIEGDFEEYLAKLRDPQQWVGEVEINALAVMYKRDFLIFQEPGKPAVNITDNNFKEKVQLCFLNGNHYDSVYPISHIRSSALCQSILYEVLYEGVFKVDRSSLGICQRSSRQSDFLSDDGLPVHSSDESDLETDDPLWVEDGTSQSSWKQSNQSYRGRGRGRQLPERVKRSLNPTMLRNVEYDVWNRSKRAQQKLDYSIAAGMQFTVGDRCQVRLENNGRSYGATVKEVPSDDGTVTVLIEELGKKQFTVPVWSLRPPSKEGSWRTVCHRDKRLSNGHGEPDDKGRGRGRGKSTPLAAGSPAPASGSGVRVQKQHSWPLQTSGEELKPSRKSVSAVEAALGVTEEERLAKEEEERNVALVEIQLRDENSFPALGSQTATLAEGGRRKGGDRKRSQRNKANSPVGGASAPSPPAGDASKLSSTPPATPIAPTPAAPKPPPVSSDSAPNVSTVSGPAPNAPPQITNPKPRPLAPTSLSPPPAAAPSKPSSLLSLSFLPSNLPAASPSSSSSSAPTFIAPIAPSPIAAKCFPRAFSPIASLPRSQTPPSSSSVVSPSAAPPSTVLSKSEVTVTAPQSHAPQIQAPSPTATPQHQRQASESQNEGGSASSPAETQLQSQSEEVQVQPPQPPPAAPLQPALQAPQVLSSAPSLGASESLESSSAQGQTEAPPLKPESPPSSQQPPNPLQPPQLPSFPLPQSLPGVVPLQQLSQVYQDPLYPGFPQGEKGDVAQIPPYSSDKSGDDLPKDSNILRFFFNLGVKAYSMSMYPPYMYLLPLLQAYSLQLKPPSPTPQYPQPAPPPRQQETYSVPLAPPPSAPPPQHYEHPPPFPERPNPGDPPFSQPGFQGNTPTSHRMPPHSMPWQQMAPHTPTYSVRYPSPTPQYSGAPPSAQVYHPGQAPVHPLYPSGPQYPPYNLGYQSSSVPEDLQQGPEPLEQLQPPNGDTLAGHAHLRAAMGPPDSPAAPNVASANNRAMMLPAGFGA